MNKTDPSGHDLGTKAKRNTRRRVSILLLSAGLLFVTLGVLIAKLAPATSYEVSIYSGTPTATWACIIGGFSAGLLVVLFGKIEGEDGRVIRWGCVALFSLVFFSLVSIHVIRSYYLWGRADPLTQLGMSLYVLLTGRSDPRDVYPALHIQESTFSMVLGAPIYTVHLYLPLAYDCVYLASMWLLVFHSYKPTRTKYLGLAIASLPLVGYHISNTPYAAAVLSLPLLLYVVLRPRSSSKNGVPAFRFCTALLLVFLTVLHPLIALVGLATIFLFGRKVWTRATNARTVERPAVGGNLLIMAIVWWVTWISSFYIWASTLRNLASLFVGEGQSQLTGIQSDFQLFISYGFSPLDLVVRQYGASLVLVVILLVATLLPRLSSTHWNRGMEPLQWRAPVIGLMTVLGLFLVLNLPFGPQRLQAVFVILGILVAPAVVSGLLAGQATKSSGQTALRRTAGGLLVCFLLVSGVFALYASPYTFSYNDQVTAGSIQGFAWIENCELGNLNISGSYLTYPPRFKAATLGFPVVGDDCSNPRLLDWHLGYGTPASSGNFSKGDVTAISTLDRDAYSEIFPQLASLRNSDADFVRLAADPRFAEVYANGDIQFWLYVEGTG